MLTIRKEQFQAMTRARLRQHRDALLSNARATFPSQITALAPDALDRLVDSALGKAEIHGLEAPGDVARLLHIMIRLGADFDRDPAFPWARKCLENPSVRDPAIRMNRLVKAAQRAARNPG